MDAETPKKSIVELAAEDIADGVRFYTGKEEAGLAHRAAYARFLFHARLLVVDVLEMVPDVDNLHAKITDAMSFKIERARKNYTPLEPIAEPEEK